MLYSVPIRRISTKYMNRRNEHGLSPRQRERTIVVSARTETSTKPADLAQPPGRLGSLGSQGSARGGTLAAVSLAAFMTYLDNNASLLRWYRRRWKVGRDKMRLILAARLSQLAR